MNRQQRRAMQKQLTPEQKQALIQQAKQQFEAQRDELQANVAENMLEGLERHKAEHGTKDLDVVVINFALQQFVHFLRNNGKLKIDPQTKGLINLALLAIPKAAVEARRLAENKRIITLS